MAVLARSAHRLVRGVGRVWLLPQGMTATTRPLVDSSHPDRGKRRQQARKDHW